MKLLRVWLTIGAIGLLVAIVSAAPPAAPTPSAAPEMTAEEKADADTGKKAAQEVEKELKVIKDSPDVPRLEAIIAALRPATERPNQQYTVKVVDSKAINAFSLPGGYLYFTKGLISAVESDDELAAVAAHEMAHVCLRHARRLMDKDSQYNRVLGSVVLAAILAEKGGLGTQRNGVRVENNGIHAGDIAAIGSLVKMNAVNHYGREAELEADHAAVQYLHASNRYSPVAMLTVVEGLARIDESQPGTPDAGVFQTHPLAQERVNAVLAQLDGLHVPIERGRVTKGLTATAAVAKQGEVEIGELRLGDRVVYQPAVSVGGVSPLGRAQRSADVLNPMLLANLEMVDILQVNRDGSALVLAKGETVITITPEDAAFHKSTVEALAQQAMQAIQLAFQAERVKRAY